MPASPGMTTYYYASTLVLSAGHIITAGHHGQRCRTFMQPQDIYTFENVCEEIRAAYFATKPSRLNCIFTCGDAAALDEFYKRYCGGRDHHYEVEPVNPTAPVHKGTWALQYGNFLHGMVNVAWVYWSQHHTQNVEIIIGGDVRVIRKIR